jgi:glycerate-2-kinase
LAAARVKAEALGYRVVDLGPRIQGETQAVAADLGERVRRIRAGEASGAASVCLLSGGETTVTLPADHGLGGRNQELVLALLVQFGPAGMAGVVTLSGGTDGEDGPTDAAGAVADAATWEKARRLGLVPAAFLQRHDAYRFFDATGDLLKTGLTHTNVMDVRVVLVA